MSTSSTRKGKKEGKNKRTNDCLEDGNSKLKKKATISETATPEVNNYDYKERTRT